MLKKIFATLTLLLVVTACSSPRAYVRMRNVGTHPVREVEMNYGVMFGVGQLNPGDTKQRYVPIAAPADLTLRFYDAANQLHNSQGPHIEAKFSGDIEVRIGDNGQVTWAITPNTK